MHIQETFIAGVFTIQPALIQDGRGSFFRAYCHDSLARIMPDPVVQINQSTNTAVGTFRGFHTQRPPYAEHKLIRATAGRVWDMALDLRSGSPTFLNVFGIELNAESHNMILIPPGCAHGFITLTENASLNYLHTRVYHKESEFCVSVFDAKLNLSLPLAISVISEKDSEYPALDADFKGIEL
jgi:dTDP-4-dehydrorhamnose 3,5-epimerase